MIRRYSILGLITAGALLLVLFFIACGGGNKQTTVSPATTTITLSDPPTCSASNSPAGPFASIIVTVTDVQIHASATAGPNDAGWIDLTPNLKNSPQPIDLLSTAASKCFLATLGTTTDLPPGTYQQMRVKLASSGNTVLLAAPGSTPQPLLLSSEAQTGIKIPANQITGGQFTVTAGQSKTLNIDFDACASIVKQGNGQYRLKPVLHAGEVNTTSNAVDGTLVDSVTKAAIAGPAIVVLEKLDTTTGTFTPLRQTTPDPTTGFFTFCPVDTGATYAIVAAVISSGNVAYAPAIITGVGPGSSLGKIPMVASSVAPQTPASVTGVVATSPPISTATVVGTTVTFSILEQVAGGSTYTIPLAQQTSATINVQTGPSTASLTCSANTDCNNYTLVLPGVTPTVVAFTAGAAIDFTGTTGNTAPVNYTVQAAANCTSSPATATVSLKPGDALTSSSTPAAPAFSLTGCTAP